MDTQGQARVNPWPLMVAAAFVLLVTIGMRMSLGLFVQPVVNTTALSVAQFSLVIAVFQLMWGVAQPVTGALADRFGARRILCGGALLLAAGCFLVPLLPTLWGDAVHHWPAAGVRHGRGWVFHHYGTTRGEAAAADARLCLGGGERGRFGGGSFCSRRWCRGCWCCRGRAGRGCFMCGAASRC